MLSIITLEELDKWDSIVKSFKNYDIYYMSQYTKAFELHGDGQPVLFYYSDEQIRAINVVMKRDIGKDKLFKGKIELETYFDMTTPYGYGGFIIEGKFNESNIKKLNEEYSNYCRSNNIISEFVRFHPVIENSHWNESIYEVVDLGKTVTINLTSKDQIWSDFSSKNRNVVRKAIKSGVEIYWGRSPQLFEKFIPMYNSTMDKDNATNYYYFDKSFYNSVRMDLKYNNMFFYAVYEGKIISMSMILLTNGNMHYHLSASDRRYQSLAATNLLLYEAACWGYENGYTTFHLGGGLGSQEDGLYKFKKAFNKKSDTHFTIGKKVFNAEIYEKLMLLRQIRSENIENEFFPTYRIK